VIPKPRPKIIPLVFVTEHVGNLGNLEGLTLQVTISVDVCPKPPPSGEPEATPSDFRQWQDET